ncbi:MAG TPA: aminotransferase class V-fold PLP-dependent enzyme, partial [Candidatus Limnocylindrales bacterium]|nr:aminotransferase class V-fold PLP-dependent enzyme [Candidatus Limnocylindrales bacterium]
FPITRRFAYLDHAAIAPLALPVRAAMERYLACLQTEPNDPDAWEAERRRIRAQLGALIRTAPARITFTRNTTSGLAIVAAGLDWRDGDNVVGVRGEYPANVYPWLALADRGVTLRLFEPAAGRIDPGALLALRDARTRVVAISWVQFWNGYRSDLVAIGDALQGTDTLLVVDGIQGLGALAFDFDGWPVDFLACGAQKWMLGPIGIGFAAVSDRILDRLRPTSVGTDSVVADHEYFRYDLRLKDDARRFEDAAPNYPGILGLGAAASLFLERGPAAVEAAVLRNAALVRDGLLDRGYRVITAPRHGREASGIVSFRHASIDPAALHRRLREAGVVLSLRGDFLRAAPHFYNDAPDIDRLLEALPR